MGGGILFARLQKGGERDLRISVFFFSQLSWIDELAKQTTYFYFLRSGVVNNSRGIFSLVLSG